jgi:Immunoglobulin I-set domain.
VFHWRKNGVNLFDGGNISGATTTSLAINNVQAADLAAYSVSVSNSFGGVVSSSASLSVATIPTIQVQPQSATNNFGSTASFSVVASGNGLAYQWQRNGTNLTESSNLLGTTSSTLVLPAVTRLDAASYTVVITNAAGNVTSDPASLTVVYALPLFEPFNYPAAANLGGQISPDLAAWADVGTSTAGPFVTVRPGNLDVNGLPRPTGSSILFGGLGKSARLSLPTGKALNNGTVYFSLMLRVLDLTGASPSGGFIAGFNNSVGTQTGQPNVVGTRLYLRTAGTGFNLGVAKNSSITSDWIWDNTIQATNQTIFLVGSYTFTSVAVTNDDIARLWINPSPAFFGSATPPPATLTATTGNDITADQIASFVFFQRSAIVEPAAMVADEFRLDTTWAGVTPAYPAPATLDIQWQNGFPRLTLLGSIGTRYQLEFAPAFPAAGWSALTNLPLPASPFLFRDDTVAGAAQRFYRAVAVP